MKSCKDCFYWHKHPQSRMDGIGECRVSPPVESIYPCGHRKRYRYTDRSSWCELFADRVEEEAAAERNRRKTPSNAQLMEWAKKCTPPPEASEPEESPW